jgi:hypothetical protein
MMTDMVAVICTCKRMVCGGCIWVFKMNTPRYQNLKLPWRPRILECQNQTAKKSIVSLAVDIDL